MCAACVCGGNGGGVAAKLVCASSKCSPHLAASNCERRFPEYCFFRSADQNRGSAAFGCGGSDGQAATKAARACTGKEVILSQVSIHSQEIHTRGHPPSGSSRLPGGSDGGVTAELVGARSGSSSHLAASICEHRFLGQAIYAPRVSTEATLLAAAEEATDMPQRKSPARLARTPRVSAPSNCQKR